MDGKTSHFPTVAHFKAKKARMYSGTTRGTFSYAATPWVKRLLIANVVVFFVTVVQITDSRKNRKQSPLPVKENQP